MKKNKHTIEKVFLEIDTNSTKVANAIKNNTNMFIQEELLILIEKELNNFSIAENEVLQIEKLSISVTNNNLKNENFSNLSFKDDFFKREIENQIRQKITVILNQTKANTNTSQETNLNTDLFSENRLLTYLDKKSNTLIYYLLYGELPWWTTNKEETNSIKDTIFHLNTIQKIGKTKNFSNQFKRIIEKKIVQQRLINQFTNEQLALIIASFQSIKSENNKEIIQKNKLIHFLDQINDFVIKESFWKTIFNYLIENNPKQIALFFHKNETVFKKHKWDFEMFIVQINDFISFNHNIKDLQKIADEKQFFDKEIKNERNFNSKKDAIKESEKTEEISEQLDEIVNNKKTVFYIQNAGLLLLHPFIKELFKSCQLIDENNTTIVNKEVATHLLHYVATKKECDYEHNMLFEKFLCGLPIGYPIKREIKIPEAYKLEAEEMLSSVVKHWTALKSTSSAIVRNEFLQRDGKLDLQESNPKIYIERKTQDILLDRIPWNISIVKIPWIEKLIYTEW